MQVPVLSAFSLHHETPMDCSTVVSTDPHCLDPLHLQMSPKHSHVNACMNSAFLSCGLSIYEHVCNDHLAMLQPTLYRKHMYRLKET